MTDRYKTIESSQRRAHLQAILLNKLKHNRGSSVQLITTHRERKSGLASGILQAEHNGRASEGDPIFTKSIKLRCRKPFEKIHQDKEDHSTLISTTFKILYNNDSSCHVHKSYSLEEAFQKRVIARSLRHQILENHRKLGIENVNYMIYNTPLHIVAVFKDYLIYDDANEFLNRFYSNKESAPRLARAFGYYSKKKPIKPSLAVLPERRIIFKGAERKEKVIRIVKEDRKKIDDVFSTFFNSRIRESIANDPECTHETKLSEPEENSIFQKLQQLEDESFGLVIQSPKVQTLRQAPSSNFHLKPGLARVNTELQNFSSHQIRVSSGNGRPLKLSISRSTQNGRNLKRIQTLKSACIKVDYHTKGKIRNNKSRRLGRTQSTLSGNKPRSQMYSGRVSGQFCSSSYLDLLAASTYVSSNPSLSNASQKGSNLKKVIDGIHSRCKSRMQTSRDVVMSQISGRGPTNESLQKVRVRASRATSTHMRSDLHKIQSESSEIITLKQI